MLITGLDELANALVPELRLKFMTSRDDPTIQVGYIRIAAVVNIDSKKDNPTSMLPIQIHQALTELKNLVQSDLDKLEGKMI